MKKNIGTKPPYGYTWHNGDLVLVPEEVPIYKELFDLYLVHQRKGTALRLLNEKGYRTRAGNLFNYTAVSRMLKNTVAKGIYSYSVTDKISHISKKVEITVPAIVSEEQWNQVQDIMTQQGGKQTRSTSQDIFVGKLYCECDQTIRIPSKSKNYICSDCNTDIPIDDIHAIFEHSIKNIPFPDRNDLEKLAGSSDKNTQSVINGKISKLERDIEKLFDLHSCEAITNDVFKSRHDKLNIQLTALKVNLTSLSNSPDTNYSTLYDFWLASSSKTKQLFLDTVLDRITLKETVASVSLYSLFNFAQQTTESPANGGLLGNEQNG